MNALFVAALQTLSLADGQSGPATHDGAALGFLAKSAQVEVNQAASPRSSASESFELHGEAPPADEPPTFHYYEQTGQFVVRCAAGRRLGPDNLRCIGRDIPDCSDERRLSGRIQSRENWTLACARDQRQEIGKGCPQLPTSLGELKENVEEPGFCSFRPAR